MRRRIRLRFWIIAACTAAVMVSARADAGPATATDEKAPAVEVQREVPGAEHPAAKLVDTIGREVLRILHDPAFGVEQRSQEFRKILTLHLDIPVIAKFVLGQYWPKATSEQRKAYNAAFRDFIVHRYATLLANGWKPESFQVLKTQEIKADEFLVLSKIERADNRPLEAIFRLRSTEGTYRVVDVLVEGVSLLVAQRKEFASVLREQGGIDGLIGLLKEKSS